MWKLTRRRENAKGIHGKLLNRQGHQGKSEKRKGSFLIPRFSVPSVNSVVSLLGIQAVAVDGFCGVAGPLLVLGKFAAGLEVERQVDEVAQLQDGIAVLILQQAYE